MGNCIEGLGGMCSRGNSGVNSEGGLAKNNNIVDNSVYLYSILPEEIWGIILTLIEDGRSLHNMFVAFPCLRISFKDKIPLWPFDQVFPSILPYLSKGEIHKCTHVCNSWRRVILKFSEEHPFHRHFNLQFPDNDSNSLPITIISNPLMERSLILKFCTVSTEHLKFTKKWSVNLLQEFGKEIWHFKIFSYLSESSLDFQIRCRACILLVPNLRSLHIVTVKEMSLSSLEDQISQLPSFGHLNSLTLELECGRSVETLNSLKAYAETMENAIVWNQQPGLKTLQIILKHSIIIEELSEYWSLIRRSDIYTLVKEGGVCTKSHKLSNEQII